jgi:hypothetical protein
MLIEEYEYLQRNPESAPLIRATDLPNNREDRTLLYGYTVERTTWHVYLKDGLIHRIEYRSDAKGPYMVGVCHGVQKAWAPRRLLPDKRAYPERTDYQFARLCRDAGCRIEFTTYDADRVVQDAAFQGLILEEMV